MCLVCIMVRRSLCTPPPKNFREIVYHRLGPFDAVISRCCEVCSSVFSPDIRGARITAPYDEVHLFKALAATSYISIAIGEGNVNKDLGLLLDGKPTQKYGYAYKVDPKWVDIERIRGWLNKCLKYHGTVCPVSKSSNPSLQTRPAWLIDVKRMCIIPATTGMHYIALSLCLGSDNDIEIAQMQSWQPSKESSLRNSLYSSYLPSNRSPAPKHAPHQSTLIFAAHH